MHHRVLLQAVPPEIILPVEWFVVFATAPDGANPIVALVLVRGLDVSRQVALCGKTLVADATARPGSNVVGRA